LGEPLTMLLDLFRGGLWHFIINMIDLCLVYYLIYRMLLLIRGTRTVPMAIGLGIVFFFYLTAKQVGLLTLYSLLEVFMSVVVIFTLIVFQDDIRRALIRVGRFAWFSKTQETQVVEEVIKASATLATHKIGAIIIFERDAALDEFIESGTAVDAAVTKELLFSIFVPRFDNPLHDGAVIIRNYRIYQAGTFLPLSVNPHIDKALGTRHRAAIGITEMTDAVVVVVSEERGSISLCYQGNMARNLDAVSLRKALLGLFSKSPSRKSGKKEKKTRTSSRASRVSSSIAPRRTTIIQKKPAEEEKMKSPASESTRSAGKAGDKDKQKDKDTDGRASLKQKETKK